MIGCSRVFYAHDIARLKPSPRPRSLTRLLGRRMSSGSQLQSRARFARQDMMEHDVESSVMRRLLLVEHLLMSTSRNVDRLTCTVDSLVERLADLENRRTDGSEPAVLRHDGGGDERSRPSSDDTTSSPVAAASDSGDVPHPQAVQRQPQQQPQQQPRDSGNTEVQHSPVGEGSCSGPPMTRARSPVQGRGHGPIATTVTTDKASSRRPSVCQRHRGDDRLRTVA